MAITKKTYFWDFDEMNIQQLEKASETYYTGNPTMTDAEFDAAIAELRKDSPDHPFLKRIGAPTPGTVKVKHQIPMGSLANANNEKEFEAWLSRCELAIPNSTSSLCMSHKLDGSSLELIYENGSFVQAITRGDGEEGEDVTRNVLLSGNIPLSIHSEITSVRCECLIHKDDWTKHFKGDANPRNSAAGTLRRHDGHNAQYLHFYAFDVLTEGGLTTDVMKSDFDNMCFLSQWFKVPEFVSMSANDKSYPLEYIMDWCNSEENRRDSFPYEIDGIVLKVDNRVLSSKLGITNNRPKGQVAFKFTPRGSETILNNVVWQVGHTGAITPIGEVSPVGVGGTTISRVTLCNMDEIDRLGIAIGDTVEVVRAGDVIPKLSRLIKTNESCKLIQPPKKCPKCDSKTVKDGARLYCKNDKCPGISFGRVMTWIKKRNILHIGEGLVKSAAIDETRQLYVLSHADWARVKVGNGVWGKKRASNVMAALEKSKDVTLANFLGSIGITGIGRRLARHVCRELNLKTLDDAFTATSTQIAKLDGFSYSRANDFCGWLLKYRYEVYDLALFMNFVSQPDPDGGEGGSFQGETICFTGKSPKTRSEMSQLAETAGASVSSSVSSNTTILVIADPNSQSSKAVRARKMGMTLMSPEDFLSKVGV